jgi:hypothetical protein
MASFLNANRSFMSLSQCEHIPAAEISDHIPSHILVGALDGDEMDDMLPFIHQYSTDTNLDERVRRLHYASRTRDTA